MGMNTIMRQIVGRNQVIPIWFFTYFYGVEYWKCIKRRPYCPGRIHVEAAIHQNEQGKQYKTGTVKNTNHNHAPIDPSIRIGQMALRKQSIAENPTSTRQVIR